MDISRMALPESGRTFKAYRSANKAIRRASSISSGRLRVWNLTGQTGDSRDVYFVVSHSIALKHSHGTWSWQPRKAKRVKRS